MKAKTMASLIRQLEQHWLPASGSGKQQAGFPFDAQKYSFPLAFRKITQSGCNPRCFWEDGQNAYPLDQPHDFV